MFHQRQMHQNTRVTTDPARWPDSRALGAEGPGALDDARVAYVRLRQIMSEMHNPDEEQFFLRQEFDCKRHLGTRFERAMIDAYRVVSGYGWSVTRPLCALGVVILYGWSLLLVPVVWSGQTFAAADAVAMSWRALGLSVANTLGFLGLGRLYAPPGMLAALPDAAKIVGAVQALLGIGALFFLGLGLRNRFRLK